ncbi:MAG: AI-2E family transporter [Burkholderiales bacterium]|nr:AI-2E family transporter [Burkholderiales bacterium]
MGPERALAVDDAAEPALTAAPGVPAIRIPVEARSLALAVIAVIAVIVVLEWAKVFVISLLVGILVAYTLNPAVTWLERIRLPRVVATLVVMLIVVGGAGLGAYALRGQMQRIVAQLPEAASKFSAGLARLKSSQLGNMQKMQSAATAVEKAAAQATDAPPAARQAATRVVIEQPTFKLGDFFWAGSKGAMGAVGQAAMVLFLAFFLLVGGDTFKRKLVRLAGPTLSQKKVTVTILDNINGSIQKYLFMMLVTNALVGLMVWIAFSLIGLDNAGAWAVTAALFHVVPYLGPGVTAIGAGMAAFIQFDSFPMVLLVAGSSLAIATFVGTFVTTWMTGRIARMNAAAVFVSLLFWGWLWGVWGMLLSIPIIVIVKVVAEHVEELQPMAELLGE